MQTNNGLCPLSLKMRGLHRGPAASNRLLAHDLELKNQRSPIFVLIAGDQGKLLEGHWRHNELGPVADDHPPVLRGSPSGLIQLPSPKQELVGVSVDVEEFRLGLLQP